MRKPTKLAALALAGGLLLTGGTIGVTAAQGGADDQQYMAAAFSRRTCVSTCRLSESNSCKWLST